MCGIVGVTNAKKAAPIIFTGLKKLEYRGYDSAGIYVRGQPLLKTVNRVASLEGAALKLGGSDGLGHTRWATHGGISLENAHPHQSQDKTVTLVHNGVITNYLSIKKKLEKSGYHFRSETDTEVLGNLISFLYQKESGDVDRTLSAALKLVEGELGVALVIEGHNGIFFLRRGSPLAIAKSRDTYYITSDILALDRSIDQWYFPEDECCGYLSKDEQYIFKDNDRKKLTFVRYRPSFDSASKKHFKHFMKKEIFEEPEVIKRLQERYVKGGKLCFEESLITRLKTARKIKLLGCGSSFFALNYVRNLHPDLPLETAIASEFAAASSDTIYIAVSQSGETFDLLSAAKSIKESQSVLIALTNIAYSSLARFADHVIQLCAGPEMAVASTKCYLTSIIVLDLLFKKVEGGSLDGYFEGLERSLRSAFKSDAKIKKMAAKLSPVSSAYFIARGTDFPLAEEGALKLKEVSYIHAEAIQAGELKHGPIATLSPVFPVVAIAATEENYKRLEPNIIEVKARRTPVFIFAPNSHGENSIAIEPGLESLPGLGLVLALELLSYYTARVLERDIDKPRNLAKSVTVR